MQTWILYDEGDDDGDIDVVDCTWLKDCDCWYDTEYDEGSSYNYFFKKD